MARDSRRSFPLAAVGALVLMVLALAGCVRAHESAPVESWTRDGEPVGIDVISSYEGSGHCGREGVWFLHLSAPIHPAREGEPKSAQYVRDPEGVLGLEELRLGFRAGVTLPEDAKPTGYQREGTALWLAESDRESTAYLVTENPRGAETWPRARPNIGCD